MHQIKSLQILKILIIHLVRFSTKSGQEMRTNTLYTEKLGMPQIVGPRILYHVTYLESFDKLCDQS